MPQNSLTPDSYMAQQGQGASSNGSALTPDSYMAQQQGNSPAASAPSSDQGHWTDSIVKAWNWATTPFSGIDKATDSDEVARQKIQHIGDVEALHATPEDNEPKWYLGGHTPLEARVVNKEFYAGVGRDIARTLGSPMGVVGAVTGPLAAAGETGEVPAIISKAARATQAATSLPFVGTGAHHVYQGAKEMVPQSMGGGGKSLSDPDVEQKLLSGAAEMAGGAAGVMSAVRPPALKFSAEQMDSFEQDLAEGVQKHIKDFSTQERQAAGQQIADVDEAIDAAHPAGAINGGDIIHEFAPTRQEMFPSGAKVEPRILSRVTKQETPLFRDASGNIIPQQVIDDLRAKGILNPQENMWSASEARQLEGALRDEAYSLDRAGNRRGAATVRNLASRIHDARQTAAEAAGLGEPYRMANARYKNYLDAFVDGPTREILDGQNASDILDPFTGPNREVIRRDLMKYGDDLNVKGLQDVGKFHLKAATAYKQNGTSIPNRLATSVGMFLVGNALGHPLLGMMGAAAAGRSAISGALERGQVGREAGNVPIEPVTSKYSLPMPERSVLTGKAARGAVTAGTVGANESASSYAPYAMFLQAATEAQKKPGKYGIPQFYNPKTGQRLRHDGQGGYFDVDSGKDYDWRWTGEAK